MPKKEHPPSCGPEMPGSALPGPVHPAGWTESNADEVAMEATEALLQVTRTICVQSGQPATPELAQQIFQRGRLLEEMGRLPLASLSGAIRQQVLNALNICRELDVAVTQNLSGYRDSLENQLHQARDTRALLKKYRIEGEEAGTRNREA